MINKEIQKAGLKALLLRRKAMRAEYESLMSQPQSYGITGSVSATNQRLADLRSEIAAIDGQISDLLHNRQVMSISLPDYKGGTL